MQRKEKYWKVENPFFYREKSFSICKMSGQQSLKQPKTQPFRRQRHISMSNIDKEKIIIPKQHSVTYQYKLPPLVYPIIRLDITPEEYNQTLEKRIAKEKEQKSKQQWNLPIIELDKEKYSIKPYLQRQDLNKSIERFDD